MMSPKFVTLWTDRGINPDIFATVPYSNGIAYISLYNGERVPFQRSYPVEKLVAKKLRPPFERLNFAKAQHEAFPLYIDPDFDYAAHDYVYIVEGLPDWATLRTNDAPALAMRDKGSFFKAKDALTAFFRQYPNIKRCVIIPDPDGWKAWTFNAFYMDFPVPVTFINITAALNRAGVEKKKDVNDLWLGVGQDKARFFDALNASVESVEPPYDWTRAGDDINLKMTADMAVDFLRQREAAECVDEGCEWRVAHHRGLLLKKEGTPLEWNCRGSDIGAKGIFTLLSWLRHETTTSNGHFNEQVREVAEWLGDALPLKERKPPKAAKPTATPEATAETPAIDDTLLLGNRAQVRDKLYPLTLPGLAQKAWEILVKKDNASRLFLMDSGPRFVENGATKDLTQPHLQAVCNESIRWQVTDGQDVAQRAVPADVCQHMLYSAAIRTLPLPPLQRITHAPYFGANRKLHAAPGYAADQETLYYPSMPLTVPPVPDAPTPEDVTRAKEQIEEVLQDFPFAKNDKNISADKTNAIALMIEPFIRSWFPLTPLYVVEAATPRTGKGLLAEVCLFPALGHAPAVTTAPAREEEWKKEITALLSGTPVVVAFDNIHQTLGSQHLAAALTATRWKDRSLGRNDVTVEYSNRSTWIALGNNVRLSDEIVERSVRIRLVATCENPGERTGFKHDNLLEYVAQHRGDLVWSILTLIQHYIASGQPAPKIPIVKGRFESWARHMQGVLECAGYKGFYTNQADLRNAATADAAEDIRPLIVAMSKMTDKTALSSRKIFESLCLGTNPPISLPADKDQQGRINAMGYLLGRNRDRIFEIDDTKWQLRAEPKGGRRNLWFVQQV